MEEQEDDPQWPEAEKKVKKWFDQLCYTTSIHHTPYQQLDLVKFSLKFVIQLATRK